MNLDFDKGGSFNSDGEICFSAVSLYFKNFSQLSNHEKRKGKISAIDLEKGDVVNLIQPEEKYCFKLHWRNFFFSLTSGYFNDSSSRQCHVHHSALKTYVKLSCFCMWANGRDLNMCSFQKKRLARVLIRSIFCKRRNWASNSCNTTEPNDQTVSRCHFNPSHSPPLDFHSWMINQRSMCHQFHHEVNLQCPQPDIHALSSYF